MQIEQQIYGALSAAFRFVVAIDGTPVGAFTECTLPAIALDSEVVKEGGLNTYVHQLPGPRKPAKITLKNGVGIASPLIGLYQAAMNERFRRVSVSVTLLNPLFVPVMVLNIRDAYPVTWTGPELRADGNTVAIESLELVCGEIVVS
jgi:phage tail-like protein